MRSTKLARKFCCVLLFVSILFLGRFSRECLGEIPAAQLENILTTIRSAREKVESAKIVIQTKTRSDVPESELSRLANLVELVESTQEFAFSGNKRYLKIVKTSHPFGYQPTPHTDPHTKDVETRIFSGKKQYVLTDSVLSIYSPLNLQQIPGYFFGCSYFDYICWYMPDPTAASNDDEDRRKRMFPDDLIAGKYSAQLQYRDGQEMLLIEKPIAHSPAVDQVWLDPRFGWMMAFRECISKGPGGRTGVRITYSNPIQVHEGFWVPGKVVVEAFAPDEVVEKYGKDRPWIVTTLEATVTDINSVNDSLFVLPKLSPKLFVIDYAASPAGAKPGTSPIQYFADNNGKIVERELVRRSRPLRTPIKEDSPQRGWLIAGCVICIVILSTILIYRRRLRARR